MVPHIDDAPTHRLRLHPRTRPISRHPEPQVSASRPPDVWIYRGLVAAFAILAVSQLFTLAHVR